MSGCYRVSRTLPALLALTLVIAGCYSFRGGGGMPAHVRTLYVAPIENETDRFDVDQQILSVLNERLPRALGLRPAAEANADAIIRATVLSYDDAAQNYRPGAQPGSIDVLQHQVRIGMRVQIVDVRRNEILYEAANVRGSGEYRPDTQSDVIARARAIELLIQAIIDGAQSQW